MADEFGAPKRRMLATAARGAVIAGVVLFVGLLVYGLVTTAPRTGIDDSLARAEPIPAPKLRLPVLQRGDPGPRLSKRIEPALADGSIALPELRGTPVVVNFWASWCAPCRDEAPLLERRWQEARERGVLFLGLDMQDLTEDARAFMRSFDISYPNVRDQSNGVALDWGVTGLPETFFVDVEGNVVGHVIGVVSAGQLEAGIAAARSGEPVGSLQGGASRPTR